MRWLPPILSPFLPKSLTGLRRKTPPPPLPRPTPPVCVIGDVHGRLDLLDLMLAQIADRAQGSVARIVFVGDIIDRGPHSAAVLARVMALTQAQPARVICLMGNHERMLLDFLADPAGHGPRWIAAGGAETLLSYGLSPWGRVALPDLARGLQDAMGTGTQDWLAGRPLSWACGTLGVTHAGADPTRGLDAQTPARLLWGAPDRAQARSDGMWIAQGHIRVKKAHAADSRIMVDTGAWRSGQLSAAWLDANGLSFLGARAAPGA